jgi:plastocyanin domain-containing protein
MKINGEEVAVEFKDWRGDNMRIVATKENGGKGVIEVGKKVRLKKLARNVVTEAYEDSDDPVPDKDVLDEFATRITGHYTF